MTESSEEVENRERRRRREKRHDIITKIKDPEQKFLTARQNRNKEKEEVLTLLPAANNGGKNKTKNKNKDELHKFWSILRTKLSIWQIQLDKILLLSEQNKHQQGTETSLHNNDNDTDDDTDNDTDDVLDVPNNNNNNINNNNINVRQQLEDLKQELQLLRKHCLSTTDTSISIVIKTNGSNNNNTEDEEWIVPDFLPVGDLRLLHTEFTNYNKKWEDAKDVLLPKEKFTFRKYRQELARRKALGLSLITGTDNNNNNNEKGERQQSKICESQQQQQQQQQQKSSSSSSSPMLEAGSGLQNFDDVSISIEEDGQVTFSTKDCDNNNATKITTESLVLRNLENCIVRIDKPLQALHLVNIRGTDSGSDTNTTRSKITITKPISSSIHITNCHNTTVEIDQQVQQIRLHESSNLICKVNSVSAGTILEDCTGIVFVVVVVTQAKLSLPSSSSYDSSNNDNNDETVTSSLDVNDFNWLREGIPSPNYRIERICIQQEKKQESQTTESSPTNSTSVAEAAHTNTLEMQSSDNIGRMEESGHAAKVQTDNNKADTSCEPKMHNGDFIVDGGSEAQRASNHQSGSTKEGDDDDDPSSSDDDDEL